MEIPTLASLKEQEPAPRALEEPLQEQTAQSEPEEKPRSKNFWPDSIEETIKLVMSGRRDLLEHLRSQLAEVPELWRHVSDLTRTAIQGWAKKISRGHVAFEESIVLASIEEREKLLGKASTAMERSVIDRYIINKLQLAHYDLVASCADEATTYSKIGVAIEKRHRSAEYQFREATRQLTKIRTIQKEIAPDSPVSASIRLFDPDASKRKEVA